MSSARHRRDSAILAEFRAGRRRRSHVGEGIDRAIREIDEPVDSAHPMIGWDVVLQTGLVEHRFCANRRSPIIVRPPIPRATDPGLHHPANDDFFDGISHLRPC